MKKLCTACGGIYQEHEIYNEGICPCCYQKKLVSLIDPEKINEIVTHNGKFHCDEIVSVAMLKIIFPEASVIRSREEDKISVKEGRILVDVGKKYDPEKMAFDHHQMTLRRAIPGSTIEVRYSSLGLIWEHFGYQIISAIAQDRNIRIKDETTMLSVYNQVLKSIVVPIDISDTIGNYNTGKRNQITLQSIVNDFNGSTNNDRKVEVLCNFIKEWVILYIDSNLRNRYLENFFQLDFDRAIENKLPYVILDRCGSWIRFITAPGNREKYDSIKFVIFQDPNTEGWKIQGVPISNLSREVKVKIPVESINNAGISFIHPNQFIAEADSMDAAINLVTSIMAKKAEEE